MEPHWTPCVHFPCRFTAAGFNFLGNFMHIFAVTPCQAFVDPAWHGQCQTPVEACTLLFSLSETMLEAIVAVWIWHTSDGTPSFGHALLAHAVCKCLAVGKMVGNPGEKRRRSRVLTDHHLPQKHKIAVSIRHVKSSRARGSMMAPLRDILAEEAVMFRIRRSMHICLKHLTG